MRNVIGSRRARIRLDAEMVNVAFDIDEQLRVEEPGGDVSGEGGTDRDTVLDMLDGYIEVTDAIIEGRLAVSGETDNVSRMFVALEILLDGSTRIPPLQELARDFREDPCRPARGTPKRRSRPAAWHPIGHDPAERSVLDRHDLLP